MNLGVDIATRRLAIACWEQGWATSIVIKKARARATELDQLCTWLREECLGRRTVWARDTDLWIEDAYMGSAAANPATLLSLGETIGAVMAAAGWNSALTVGQSTWKSQVCGNGSFGKPEVKSWLIEFSPARFDACTTQDEIDAMCISYYGCLREDGSVLPPVKRPKPKRKQRTDIL